MVTDRSPAVVSVVFQTFAVYLRETRKIKSSTIDQYVSHCRTGLFEQNWQGAQHIRSDVLSRMLRGWYRLDIQNNPQRLTSSIPATASVMEVFFTIAATYYASQPRKSAEIQACAAATYYLALRAAEGAAKSTSDRDEESPNGHHIRADKAFFRFKDDPKFYLAVAGTVFPSGATPISFDVLQDTGKNFLQRGSAHRGAHRNPSSDGKPFDVVLIIWGYVCQFPPTANGAFFPNILAADLTTVMKMTAVHPNVKLDPNRLTARCMRSGSATMLRNMKNNLIEHRDLEMIRDHGQWTSNVGNQIYAHASPDAERLIIAPSLYDCDFMTLHYLRWFYMTPV